MSFLDYECKTPAVTAACRTLMVCVLALISGCTAAPQGVRPVEGFELQRYLGKWYEIARLDHSFERGLSDVTAQYSLREDGGVRVLNRGFNAKKKEWKSAEGKAFFVTEPDVAHLRVSFFGPFYGAYVVVELDPDYRYALVSGPDRGYLWILSRTPDLSQSVIDRLVARAAALDFPVEELIFVSHQKNGLATDEADNQRD